MNFSEARGIAWRTIAEFLGITEPADVITGAGATKFLRGDASWQTVTVGAISLTATDRLVGRASAGAGAAEEIACTAAGRALIGDASAAAQRVTLGVPSMDDVFFFAMLNRKPSARSERMPILG